MKREVNEKKQTLQMLMKVGIPIVIQYMLTASVGLISSVMAGRLGDQAVAALGIGNQIFFVYSLVVFGLFAGAGVLMAQLYGSGDLDHVKKTILLSSTMGMGVGVVFLLLEKTCVTHVAGFFTSDPVVIQLVKGYMDAVILSYVLLPVFLAFSTGFRSIKQSDRPMLISLVSVVINTAIGYGFIYGKWGLPVMGIAGAGVATVVSRSMEMLLVILVAQRSILAVGIGDFKVWKGGLPKLLLKVSLPVVINELCWGLGMVTYNIFYGHIGLQALTAVQINSVLQNFFMTLVFGASGAAAILVGNSVGEKDYEKVGRLATTILKISLPVSIATGLAMMASAKLIVPLYSVSPQVIQSFLYIAWIAGVMMPVKFFAVLMITGILRGGGDAIYTMWLELGTMWLIGVPVALVAVYVLKLPVHMAFGMVFVEDVLKCILAYRRYRSKKWMTDYTTALA